MCSTFAQEIVRTFFQLNFHIVNDDGHAYILRARGERLFWDE
jgi:hypothetical protein